MISFLYNQGEKSGIELNSNVSLFKKYKIIRKIHYIYYPELICLFILRNLFNFKIIF